MAKDRPNVLLLFTDQQRFDTIAAAGHSHMITPNLDRLVNEGCTCTRAYSPNPVCVPARHNLITGLTARYHGYASNFATVGDPSLPTLPRILSDNGYETRAIGKMHFRPARRHNGFDKMELMEELPGFREQDEYAMYLKEVGLGHIRNIHGIRNLLYMVPQRSLIPEEHHGSTWVGDRSVDFIRTNNGRHPFFLWSSWIAPHPPFDVPDTFADLYKGHDLPEPHGSETPVNERIASLQYCADLPAGKEKEHLRRMREVYYAQISLVDKNVGKILDALEEIGQLDNTLIIFTSDHGEMLGDHGAFQKQCPYDGASRIPFLVRWPDKIAPGTVRQDFVDLNDILPTVLDVCGVDYPGQLSLPGGSLFRGDKDRSVQYIESAHRERRFITVLDERYKYSYFYAGGEDELYDLQDDPQETTNLLVSRADDTEVGKVRDRLRRILWRYEDRWGLENYTTIEGEFLKMVPQDFKNVPHYPLRNGQFDRFADQITDPEERAAMNDLEQEVIEAVSREELVNLHELDLRSWEVRGAPKSAIERIRKESL